MKKMEGVAIGTGERHRREPRPRQGELPVDCSPAQESYWAPIASLMAGKKRGARFMPERDDEVLVAFDHGDFDHPYVVGFLWNGADKAPDDNTPEPRHRDAGRPRASLRGQGRRQAGRAEDDGRPSALARRQGSRKVTLATKSGGKVTLDNAPGTATVEASGNRVVISPAGISILVATGTLSVTSSAVTSVQSTGVMNVTAPAINLTAGVLNVTAPLANFSGVVRAQTVLADLISGVTYTPGVGNLV